MNKNMNKEVGENLYSFKNSILKLKSEIARIYAYPMLELYKEQSNNIRNFIIISGTFTTLIILIISNMNLTIFINNLFIFFSLISFLISILFYSFYLQKGLELVFKNYENQLNFYYDRLEEIIRLIDSFLENKLSYEEFEKDLYNKLQLLQNGFLQNKAWLIENSGNIGKLFFYLGIILFIFSFILISLSWLELPNKY